MPAFINIVFQDEPTALLHLLRSVTAHHTVTHLLSLDISFVSHLCTRTSSLPAALLSLPLLEQFRMEGCDLGGGGIDGTSTCLSRVTHTFHVLSLLQHLTHVSLAHNPITSLHAHSNHSLSHMRRGVMVVVRRCVGRCVGR